MSGEILIRAARRDDLGQIVEFNAAIARETESLELDRERLTAGVQAVFDQPERGRYFLAARDDQVIGQAMITTEWSDWRNGDVWWLQSVFVAPSERGQGVFGCLFREIEKRARQEEARGLRLYVARDNARAQKIYSALGMHTSHYQMMEVDFVIAREEQKNAAQG